MDIKLESGREIKLYSLTQTKTYFGLLEGVPRKSRNDGIVQRVMEQVGPEHSVLIPPIRTDLSQIMPDFLDKTDAELLPSITSIGQFESWTAAKDPSRDCSYLTVIWFQDAFGLPTHPEILQQFHQLDWDASALDGDL